MHPPVPLRITACLGVAVLGAMGLSGCTIARYYGGAPLRSQPSALIEGQSTKHEVLQRFGPPTLITHQTDGDAFVYAMNQINYSSFTVTIPIFNVRIFTYTRRNDQRDAMVVLFDFGGTVRSIAVEHRIEQMPPV